MEGYEEATKWMAKPKLPEYYHKPAEKFTGYVRNHIAEKIYRHEQDGKKLSSNNIHYRITCFLSKLNVDSKSSRIFDDWLIKTITNQSISLK